ncbi:MAG: DUF1579 domain-containing protein [Planctomycetota bacterium]|jgi:hypothetical protein
MRIRQAVAGCVIAVGAFALGQALAQERDEGQGMPQPTWQKLTPHHEQMKKSVGEWQVAGEYAMGPGAPLQPFTATAKREMILGGRFVLETFTCSFGGMPYEGRLLMGYDTVRKEYVSVWVDSSSPVMGISRGAEKDGVMTLTGEDPDLMTGRLKKTKSVVKPDHEDQVTMSMYDVAPDGSERLTMRLVYKRKK